ncbi:unnamed protein product [Clavelina lepadiformis]|uniref:Uncharacterized protein n=1 Tax=Clavelina lepadiformis TaxID=159417 RepID=A0ABP0FSU3_CLALP
MPGYSRRYPPTLVFLASARQSAKQKLLLVAICVNITQKNHELCIIPDIWKETKKALTPFKKEKKEGDSRARSWKEKITKELRIWIATSVTREISKTRLCQTILKYPTHQGISCDPYFLR